MTSNKTQVIPHVLTKKYKFM